MEKELFENILEGLNEVVDIKQGKRRPARITIVQEPDAKKIRDKLELSRSKFAMLIGVSERTVEKWEQGVTQPSGAARSLLIVADKKPRVVLEALHQ